MVAIRASGHARRGPKALRAVTDLRQPEIDVFE